MAWPTAWFEDNLACPYDGGRVSWTDQSGRCEAGHRFPIVHGVPVLVRTDVDATHHMWRTTEADVARLARDETATRVPGNGVVDWFVERWLVGTCGNLYRARAAPLPRYPIPNLPLPAGEGRLFLDVGSNWGRWSLAASRLGYRAVAIDPSLDAALAGTRVARQLGLPVAFVVGDARFMPFKNDTFDVAFSYSVLQHLTKDAARTVLSEISRVTRLNGQVRVQIANALGPKQLFNHAADWMRRVRGLLRGRRRAPYGFRIRAWTPPEILRTFSSAIGPSVLSADGFFSLDAQPSDIDLLSHGRGLVVRTSQRLCHLSRRLPRLISVADSIMVESVNAKPG